MRDFRIIYGPPGTGKTTKIVSLAKENAERYGRDQITIVSLTNAAIQEVAGRIDFLDSNNISTLHAQCKRSQGAPSPAESEVSQFLTEYPIFAGNRYIPDTLREKSEAFSGSRDVTVYEQVNFYRHSLYPIEKWNREQRVFWARWKDFQVQTGHPDYTGWLEIALEIGCLPRQQVVLVDEAQDHTPLELSVVQSWDSKVIYLVGDDDQNLYGFTGANAKSFYLSGNNETVLSQSYRVPIAVHRESSKLINKVKDRKKKVYLPRFSQGSVRRINYSLSNAAFNEIPPGVISLEGTSMILASCGYLLDPVINLLKDQEIPFYNPYRTTNGRWNPLSESLQKIRAFSKPKRWNGRQASSWAINLKSDGVFHRGKKKEFLDLCEHREKDLLYSEDLKEYFMEYSLERLLSRDLSMFSEFGVRSSPSWNYGLSIVKRYGIDVEPKIIVGTIHSVKGGEADHVYVAPDLSRAGWEEYTGQHRDRVIRLFYVAMTRARESLTLLDTLHYRRIEW